MSVAIVMVLALLALPGLAWWPLAFLFPGYFLLMNILSWAGARGIAKARSGESICDFARSFDCRRVDPWIIRGVYEEFADSFPVRASDTFRGDLQLCDEDLCDHGHEIAHRVGRSMEATDENPMFGKVHTLHDLVMFLHHQPSLAAQGSIRPH